MKITRYVFVALVVTAATGCTGLVTTPTAFTMYDLGDLPADTGRAPGIAPASVEVRAPSWLSTAAMQYRLDYVTPASREAFAESRWAGHPSEMLQRLVSTRLAAGMPGAGRCHLRIELDEFVQSFASTELSQTELIARVTLITPRDDVALARQTFVVRVDASSANARGGVAAHRDGARLFGDQISAWFTTLDDGQAQENDLNIRQRCLG